MIFIDRRDAGRQLASKLIKFRNSDVVILALPRGGVVIGKEVADKLNAPLGLVMVRKIGHPYYNEYAIGAVAENAEPTYNLNEAAILDSKWLKKAETDARSLIERRRQLYYNNDFTPPSIKHKLVILVDDGMATGLTMRAAVNAIKQNKPKRIIVAIPVAPYDSINAIKKEVDEVISLDDPNNFLGAAGAHYQSFPQVSDEEVKAILRS